ncbi:MAG: vWA domain-containing protein [Myxococcota bacterium]
MHTRFVAAAAIALGACAGDDGGQRAPGATPGLGDGLAGTGDTGETSDDGDEERFDLGAEDGVPEPQDEPQDCAAVSQEASLVKEPADIIVAVDNSGSMDFEASEIQNKLNAFSQQIVASGIDVHVVLVSSYPGDGNGICIDAPLGSGGCPSVDANPPTFTHVNHGVGSHTAWPAVLDTHEQWRAAMRPDASKHVLVVSDDISNMNHDLFHAQFGALDPSYIGYRQHSVVCHSNCPHAAEIGESYILLSQLTGGIAADLCLQDFQAVFDELSTEVVGASTLSCAWEVPEPPDGMSFDPNAVNIAFSDGQGGGFDVGAVSDAGQCPDVVDGWYYDAPAAPTMIHACPQTCDRLQGFSSGSIDIVFGCETEAAPAAG